MIKRLFDLVISVLVLILLSPVFLIIGIWVKTGSEGSVFFRQERVGRHGQLFCIYKFRTMCVGAEQSGLSITTNTDPRVTKQGRFLRKYKLDELPQFLNVLLGEMSVVGPRPEIPKYMAMYPQEIKDLVLSVRPGITDLASIEFKDESRLLDASNSPERTYVNEILPIKQQYYVKYAQANTVMLDIKIIFRTLKELFIY